MKVEDLILKEGKLKKKVYIKFMVMELGVL